MVFSGGIKRPGNRKVRKGIAKTAKEKPITASIKPLQPERQVFHSAFPSACGRESFG